MSEPLRELAQLNRAKQALAAASTFEDVKTIMDAAAATAYWAKRVGGHHELVIEAAELHVRCERKAGEHLAAMEKNKGGRPNNRGHDVPSLGQPKLSEIGIEKHQSKRWQKMASVPEKQFEKIIQTAKDIKKEPTVSMVMKAAKDTAKEEKKRKAEKELKSKPLPTPQGKFDVIAIDPPWMYGARSEDDSHRARNPYPDMSVEEICKLPVAKLSEDNCIVWLWTTNAFMREAFTCLDAWGFTAKTILTWDKVIMGLGDWLRNSTEHCILAIRGKPTVILKNQTTLIREQRSNHSRKPEKFYELVEALCPGTKLEMFARTKREGWQQWGNEI